jgi:hypothetical protein
MAYACNPSNSGGRDQEDDFEACLGIVGETLSQKKKKKKPLKKKGLVEWLKV